MSVRSEMVSCTDFKTRCHGFKSDLETFFLHLFLFWMVLFFLSLFSFLCFLFFLHVFFYSFLPIPLTLFTLEPHTFKLRARCSLLPDYPILSCKVISVGRTLRSTYMFLIVRLITPWSNPSRVTISKHLALTEDSGIKEFADASRLNVEELIPFGVAVLLRDFSKGIWSRSFSFFAESVDIIYNWTRIFALSCMCHFQIQHYWLSEVLCT